MEGETHITCRLDYSIRRGQMTAAGRGGLSRQWTLGRQEGARARTVLASGPGIVPVHVPEGRAAFLLIYSRIYCVPVVPLIYKALF